MRASFPVAEAWARAPTGFSRAVRGPGEWSGGDYPAGLVMRRSALASLWLVLLAGLCACSSSPPHLQHPFVGHFAEALAFVPQGMDRIMLKEGAGQGVFEDGSQAVREIECGRPRREWSPKETGQAGLFKRRKLFEGVTISDYGSTGLAGSHLATLGEPHGDVSGYAVLFRDEHEVGLQQLAPATWSVVVDDRFLVVADSVELLQSALARPHGDIAATLVRAVDVATDAYLVAYLIQADGKAMSMVIDRSCLRFDVSVPAELERLVTRTRFDKDVRIEKLGERGSNQLWRIHVPEAYSTSQSELWLTTLFCFGYLILI